MSILHVFTVLCRWSSDSTSVTEITRKFLGSCRQMVRHCEAEDRRNFTTRLAMSTSDTVGAFKCCARIDADPEASGRLSLATQLILYTSERSCLNSSSESFLSFCCFSRKSTGCSFSRMFFLDQPGQIDLVVGFVCQHSWPLLSPTSQNGALPGTFAEIPPLAFVWCLSPNRQLQ